MGLFRRWFGETERTSHEAVASPAAPETLEQQGPRNAASAESVRSDGEQEEDSRIRAKIQDLLDTAINPALAGHADRVPRFPLPTNTYPPPHPPPPPPPP